MKTKKPMARRQSGMTLIEVLVAVLIFSLGLLGIVGLQARAIQFSVGAEDSNRAALLANEIAATMQLYDTVDVSLTAWQTRVSDPTVSGLPGGVGEVTTSGRTAEVIITWVSPSAPTDTHSYVTQVVLVP
jgi:type IV pilus assembly protein PilV